MRSIRNVSRVVLRIIAVVAAGVGIACASRPTTASYHLGTPATRSEIASLAIDISPDGTNLPSGRATAVDGATTYRVSCEGCHGRRMRLVRWTHATSLLDYIRRAMPPQTPRRLSGAELYGVTAYLLFADGRIAEHEIVDGAFLVRLPMNR